MPVINRIASFQAEMASWRQDFHRIPSSHSRNTVPLNWWQSASNPLGLRSSVGSHEPE